jgi:hypothetical protein
MSVQERTVQINLDALIASALAKEDAEIAAIQAAQEREELARQIAEDEKARQIAAQVLGDDLAAALDVRRRRGAHSGFAFERNGILYEWYPGTASRGSNVHIDAYRADDTGLDEPVASMAGHGHDDKTMLLAFIGRVERDHPELAAARS